MKTSELIGPALDWAVAKCEGWTNTRCGHACNCLQHRDPQGTCRVLPAYVSNWAQGGPIIERERIFVKPKRTSADWRAYQMLDPMGLSNDATGPTPLVAAMHCYVASKLGDEVEIPKGLI